MASFYEIKKRIVFLFRVLQKIDIEHTNLFKSIIKINFNKKNSCYSIKVRSL